MAKGKISETETVIKRIVPYLQRRGYDLDKDLHFEEPTTGTARTGFIDIVVTCGRRSAVFLIEAKRDGTKITAKHRKQALAYGEDTKCLLVALTNGQYFELLNVTTGQPLQLNGSPLNRIPTKTDLLKYVLPQLKQNKKLVTLSLPNDRALPFRPGLPLTKLNHLIKQCHNTIRNVEKNEEYAFADFSKILFLKLLEEKWDIEGTSPLYSYTFHELADTPLERADQVRNAITVMIGTIQDSTKYGNVLADPIRLRKDSTYLKIVKLVSGVSFSDCDLDTKGAAFEYFVRATLKGKRLGQYFTPRPLVKLMLRLGRYHQIVNSLRANEPFKVLDPACGTGGFLVTTMNACMEQLQELIESREVHPATGESIRTKLKEETFHGIDAHEGVASSAKMNMIVAGDGHNNIRCANSLTEQRLIPDYLAPNGATVTDGKAHLILTNPPFGTSERESLTPSALRLYEIASTRGQALFIQRMVTAAHADSLIVTVIDDGVLNTATYAEIRSYVLQTCRIEYVIGLPEETFKPNKINVKSSVLVLRRRTERDVDITDNYPIAFVQLKSLGYLGSGEEIRGFNLEKLIEEVTAIIPENLPADSVKEGSHWGGFQVKSSTLANDRTKRFDIKYWIPSVRAIVDGIASLPDHYQIKNINMVPTARGKSPPAAEYVKKNEGYALVVKAGSNIAKNGTLINDGDFIEEAVYTAYAKTNLTLEDGDILLASTGDGTLGKCCVYRNRSSTGECLPGVPDGHVTVIRVDQKEVYPEYLCDYLRLGFGAEQVGRLYTGSTGLIEITPEDVATIVVPPVPSIKAQMKQSSELRTREATAQSTIAMAQKKLEDDKHQYYLSTIPEEVPPK